MGDFEFEIIAAIPYKLILDKIWNMYHYEVAVIHIWKTVDKHLDGSFVSRSREFHACAIVVSPLLKL